MKVNDMKSMMQNVMGHNSNQKQRQDKNRKDQVKKQVSKKRSQVSKTPKKQNQQHHSQSHTSQLQNNKVVHHNVVSHNNMPNAKDMNWGLTLSVYSISVLTALKAAMNLTKRDEVVRRLFKHPVKYWLNKCNSTQKKKYKVTKEFYLLNTVGHAKKKWIYNHKK